jgi:hypothetical protein
MSKNRFYQPIQHKLAHQFDKVATESLYFKQGLEAAGIPAQQKRDE